MRVLVDTCIWSIALRRNRGKEPVEARELRRLVEEHRATIIGPIRQELLSGIRDEKSFSRVESGLVAFGDLTVESEDYVDAARMYNQCRSKGVQGSNTDFLICAVAVRHGLAVYTNDKDFQGFAQHLPVVLHEVMPSGQQGRTRKEQERPPG